MMSWNCYNSGWCNLWKVCLEPLAHVGEFIFCAKSHDGRCRPWFFEKEETFYITKLQKGNAIEISTSCIKG